MHPDAWLVVIDPQRIFADPTSQWGSPMFPDIVDPVRRLAAAAGERTVVTRWVPARAPEGSWAAYLKAWPFADVPSDDRLFDVVDETGDEQLAWFPESHRFQIPEDCHWNDVRNKASNVGAIMAERDVDGVLVGGASLDAGEFASIARFENHLVTK